MKISERYFTFPILNYIINDKYIVIQKENNAIEIIATESFKKICDFEIKEEILINNMQFHPKYYNILSVSCNNFEVYLFDINNSKIDLKVTFICNKSDNIIQTDFNPVYDSYLATLFIKGIKIWNINKYYYIYYIKFEDITERKMKWSENGEYLIYNKNDTIIEIFCLQKGIVEFCFDLYMPDNFYMLKNKSLLLILDNNISLYNITNKKEIWNATNKFVIKNSFYDYNKSLLFLFSLNSLSLYDIKRQQYLYESKINEYKKYFILNNTEGNKDNIFSKIVTYSKKHLKFKTIDFISKTYFFLLKDIIFFFQKMGK